MDDFSEIRVMKWHSDSVWTSVISNDDKIFAAGFAGGKIRVYEMNSLKLSHPPEGHNSTVLSIIFSENNDLRISSALGKEIIMWDAYV